ncbi:hypothetical protein Tco_0815002 [Tanacetum coccineum]
MHSHRILAEFVVKATYSHIDRFKDKFPRHPIQNDEDSSELQIYTSASFDKQELPQRTSIVLHVALRCLFRYLILLALVCRSYPLETISQTDRARSSRVPIPLPDDPYMAVRRAYLATITDLESEPFNDFRETEIPHPLLIAPLLVPPSDDPCLIVGQNHTPITPSHSTASSDSTTPLSPDHPLTQASPTPTRVTYYRTAARMVVRTQPTLSPGMSARIAETTALSPSSFRKRYRFSCETPSPSSSPTFPLRKRYRSTSELVEDTKDESLDSDTEGEGSKDEGPSTEGEEEDVVPEGQQQAVLIVDTTVDEPLGLGYEVLRRLSDQLVADETPTLRIPARTTWIDPEDGTVYLDIKVDPRSCAPVQTPPSPDWSPRSLLVSPSSPVVPTTVASPVTTPAATIAVDEDEFLEDRYEDHRFIHDILVQHTAMQRELQELRDRVTTLEQERSHGGQ